MTYAAPIERYLREQLELDADTELGTELPLLELNFLDSVAIFDLVHLVREEFGIVVPTAQVTPTNFATIARIDRLLMSLAAEQMSV